MARGKGKSRRRIKHWHQRYVSGEDHHERAAGRQKVTRQAVKIPAYRLEAPDEGLDELPKREGLVAGLFPGGAIVRAGSDELLCGIAKTYRAAEETSSLAVGDIVTVALTRPEHADGRLDDDRDRADGMVLSRRLRSSALVRPQPRSAKRHDPYSLEPAEKVLVANMDVLLIVASTRQPPLRRGLVDRYLIVAEQGELQPLLVINKIDLARPDPAMLADFHAIGLRAVPCSALTGEGLDALAGELAGRRTVLAGASGAGKSTLINVLIPGAGAKTRPVRIKDQRGRHTTSAAVIYELPSPNAPAGQPGLLVDTPGIRELGINLTAAELPWYFPEFEALAPQCRFNNCTHTHEPDCAVRAALDAGRILPRRYESYLRILDTLG